MADNARSPSTTRLERDAPRRPADREIQRFAGWVLILFAVAFLVQAWPRISAPFGDSHDGRNGGTWAVAAAVIRDEGDAKAGAELRDEE